MEGEPGFWMAVDRPVSPFSSSPSSVPPSLSMTLGEAEPWEGSVFRERTKAEKEGTG